MSNIRTIDIFAYLKPAYKAVNVMDERKEVFTNGEMFFQTDEFGLPHLFNPSLYQNEEWRIVLK